MTLANRTAVITGASRGLGRALAGTLAAAGARVVLVARDADAVAAAAGAIRDRGGEAFAVAADVADPDAAHSIAGRAAALAGPVEILVHNASALGPTPLAPILDTTDAEFERAVAVNLLGPFRLTRAIAGHMALAGRGTIVTISSDAATEAYPEWGAYGASKAALDHFARVLAAELAPAGVRVFSVDPGEMNTRMHADAIPDADPATLADPADVAARIAAMIEREDRAPSGARVVAQEFEVQP